MSLLFRLVYATHANGTHHKLAMDALRHLKCNNSKKWRRLILKHSELYLEGSKAPDKEFKDFKNHVLHVRDNFWGGAPQKAENWYAHLVNAIKEENWTEAVYAAGVLSHYYTDPIEPLHTAQSEAENNIHRAVEWSISKSYAELRVLGEQEFADLTVKAGKGENWVGDMVREGATTSNAYYEKLITHYDVHKGVVHPPEGLDDNSRRFIAMLLRYAAIGFARILDKAFAEAGVEPPSVSLTPQIFMAGLKIPVRWVTNKLEDAEDKKLVQAMYDELQATGTVEKNLDEDERTIRDLHIVEVLKQKPRSKKVDIATAEVERPKKAAKKTRKERRSEKPVALNKTPDDVPTDALGEAPELDQKKIDQQAANALQRIADTEKHTDIEAAKIEAEKVFAPAATTAAVTMDTADEAEPDTDQEFYLKLDDKVVDAPSIGRKTAKKLNRAGVFRVADLLAADPDELSDILGLRYIDAEKIIDWQDQARLCCEIPRLRGGHAQLLVGGGYRDSNQIAESDPRDIHPDIAAFCETSEGQRVNSSDEPPSLTDIGDWISRAHAAKLKQAA